MNIVLLIIGLHAGLFAWCFLMASFFTFLVHDQKHPDQTPQRLLVQYAVGGGALVYGLAILRNWRQCPLARRLFYAGAALGAASWALFSLSAYYVR